MRQLTRYYCISKSVLFTIKNVALQEKKKKKQTKNASELIIIEIPLFVIRKKNKGGKNEWGCIEGMHARGWPALYCFIRGRIWSGGSPVSFIGN